VADTNIAFYAQFIASKAGKNGIAVTWDVERITRSTGARSALVTGGATNITVGRRGLYGYLLTTADLILYDYVATAITADATVDQQEVAAVWTKWGMAVWDEPLTAATHNIATSSGRRVRQLSDVVIIDGIIGAGSTANTLILNGGASAVDGAYDPALVYISSGTGVGQCRNILEYEGAARRCWVDRDWKVTPAAGDEYVILADAGREHVNEGHAQSGGLNWIQLNPIASANDDAYIGQVVFIRSGTGQDQARRITDYIGATRTALVYPNWDTIPDATSTGAILPTAVMTDDQIGNAVWAHTPRTLTMSLTTLKSIMTGSKLILWRGDTLSLPMLNLGSLVGATNLWFTVKKHPADTDATAQIQISLLNGLQAIDGAPATVPANGSIVITNAVTGNITVNLAAVETAKLDVDFTGYYDVQLLMGATVTTLTHGCCSVVGDTTRRIV